ncbi:pilus assembly protein TadG-related protein [Arthrobacter sp. NPDC056886]|uniref:TadE/TadG family type IV pilus assembly protein n=1 Tax=Arthrobacter sp. NPDC056886 TaxID=3345960 RepID=UPI00367313F2
MHALTPGPFLKRLRREQAKAEDTRRKAYRERGAAAVIFALMIPVLFGALAMALDVGRLVYERQHLSNAMDAAALAGAASLPGDPVAARNAAMSFARANDPAAAPTVTFWCVVASTGAGRTVVSSQIPSVCNPGTIAGARCSETICAIPCIPGGSNSCNSITVTDDKDVAFNFAPVIGINSGNTGSLAADACKGSCGSQIPNPMDIALVADRTGSMSDANRNLMVAGIKSTLQTMTRDLQYVALGTIHRSKTSPGSCITTPSTDTTGPWMPVPFSNDYTQNPALPGGSPPLNTGSTLIKGLNCLSASSGGTYLAAPLKAAARYVLGLTPNNLGSLPARSTPARKAIILETDGQPNEQNVAASDNSLNTANDIGTTNAAVACSNLKAVAANAKAEGLLIVTVAFGDATTAQCGTGGEFVRNVLAGSASPDSHGNPSTSNNDCSTASLRSAENSDGDFFFCAASGSELGPIFVSAVNTISSNSRLIRIPG